MNSGSFSLSRLCLLLIIGLHLAYVPLIFSLPFFTKGEPREALVAQGMIRENNYVLPERLEGEIATKPPMLHWLIVLSSKLTNGLSEGDSRLPSLGLSLIFCLALFMLSKNQLGILRALLCTLVLMASIEWHRSSISSRVDLTFSALLCLSFLAFFNTLREKRRLGYLATILCLTGSILAKGPAAAFLFAGSTGLYLLLQGTNFFRASLIVLKFLLPALGLAALWYLAAFAIGGNLFLETVWLENFARFTGKMEEGSGDPHSHSFWYLVGTIPVGLAPISLVLIGYTLAKAKNIPDKVIQGARLVLEHGACKRFLNLLKENPLNCLAISITIITITFFSFPESKRSVYLLPAYPFMAILLSEFLVRQTRLPGVILKFSQFILGALCLLCTVILSNHLLTQGIGIGFDIFRLLKFNLGLIPTLLTLVASALALRVSLLKSKQNPYSLEKLLNACLCLLTAMLMVNYYVILPRAQTLSARNFSHEIHSILNPKKEWLYFDVDPYGLNYYIGSLGEKLDPKRIEAHIGYHAITSEQSLEKLKLLSKNVHFEVVHRAKEAYLKSKTRLLLAKISPIN